MKRINRLIDKSGNLVSFADSADEYYSYHQNNWANYFDKAKDRLSNLKSKKKKPQSNLIKDLVKNLEDIIKATPDEIPSIITKFTTGTYANLLSKDKEFRKEIEIAFNYSAFRKSAKASSFAEMFNIKACLYCNAQFTLAIGKDGAKKKLLFQLDHFYNKSDLPFLSLTFGNLIPSCSSCNISKSSTSFTISSHIHPFHEDAHTKFDFYIDENKALDYLLGDRNNKLLTPQINIIDPKFKKHNSTFHIESIYYKHTDVIEDLLLKALYYNKSKRDELKREFVKLNLAQSTVDRFVLGSYSLDSDINKRPLAKLSQDIGKQLKII